MCAGLAQCVTFPPRTFASSSHLVGHTSVPTAHCPRPRPRHRRPRPGEASAAPTSADLGRPLAMAGLKAGPNWVGTCKATAENLPMVPRRVTVCQGT